MDAGRFQDKDQWEYPTHYTAMSFVVEPELPRQSLTVRDCGQGDHPRPKQSNMAGPTVANSVGVILATSKSGQPRAACSSLYFDLPEQIEWRMVFYQKTAEDTEIDLPISWSYQQTFNVPNAREGLAHMTSLPLAFAVLQHRKTISDGRRAKCLPSFAMPLKNFFGI